jgi:hypothetical protein
MAELIHGYATRATTEDGTVYVVKAYAEETADGTWAGWLEFHPVEGGKAVLRTDQETSQSSRANIETWASGLEPAYFEGAFARARRQPPSA